MNAAIVRGPNSTPVYGTFRDPIAGEGQTIIRVAASALSHLAKSRASGAHYSSDGVFPAVPGTDGVGLTPAGQRVYFALPEAPFGSMGELALVRSEFCIPVPAMLGDVTAAAIANPGMSAWAALVERARLKRGESVLVNGATGTAGRIAVQAAKYLGARRVLATGRNQSELEELKALGADEVIPFSAGLPPSPAEEPFEKALIEAFHGGIDVVVDYLCGGSARTIITAIAKGVEDGRPVRFVHVGAASGEDSIDLPGAALRSSSIVLMGSGLKSVPVPALLNAIKSTFEAAIPARLSIATKAVPLAEVEHYWSAPGKPRVVFTP